MEQTERSTLLFSEAGRLFGSAELVRTSRTRCALPSPPSSLAFLCVIAPDFAFFLLLLLFSRPDFLVDFQQVLLEPSSSKPDCRSSSSKRGERGPTVTGAEPRLRLRASATWFLGLPLRLLGCSRSCLNALLFLSMEEDMRPAQDIFSPSPRTSYSCTEAKCCAIFTQYVATEESSCSSKRCTAFFHWRAAMAASMALREQLRERAQEVSG